MKSNILNMKNRGWADGKYALFLGEPLGLHDTINVVHPKLVELYERQRDIDWAVNEVSLQESNMDVQRAPKYITDLMLKNLSYQWEIDSIASRSFATLLAPFITNTEFWKAVLKNQEMEIVHSDTYSEIVRQCIPNITEFLESVTENEKIFSRASLIVEALEDLQKTGARYLLGEVENNIELYDKVLYGIFAIYLTERLQFMSSFATTFITAEQGYFVGMCKLIQKIAIDEATCHAATLEYVLSWSYQNDPRCKQVVEENKDKYKALYDYAIKAEYEFSKYIFSEGRKITGLTYDLLKEWVDFNAYFAGRPLELVEHKTNLINPLPYMKNWLDIDSFQNANQEADNTNYKRINAVDDIDSDMIFDF